MSSDAKRPYDQAYSAAQRFEELLFSGNLERLYNLTSQYRWAGSLRRERQQVGDLELVVNPRGSALWDHLNVLLAQGAIAKHLDANGKAKWNGKLYRALEFTPRPRDRATGTGACATNACATNACGDGPWTVEVFCADERNWGLIWAIRTGSFEFSKMLVSRIAARGKHRVGGGYLRPFFAKRGEEERALNGNTHWQGLPCLTDTQVKALPVIDCPDELTVFDYAGLQYVEPRNREVAHADYEEAN